MRLLLLILVMPVFSCGPKSNDKQIASEESEINKIGEQIQQASPLFDEPPKDSIFMPFWWRFVEAVKASDVKQFDKMSLRYIHYRDTNVTREFFWKKNFRIVFDDSTIKALEEPRRIYLDSSSFPFTMFPEALQKYLTVEDDKKVSIKRLTIITTNVRPPATVFLEFVKSRSGYRLYDCDYSRLYDWKN